MLKIYPDNIFEDEIVEDFYYVDSLTQEKIIHETSSRFCKEDGCWNVASSNGMCERHNKQQSPRDTDYRNKLIQSGRPIVCANKDGKFGFTCCNGAWIPVGNLDVDHKDENHFNNELDNLQWLCKMSHYMKSEFSQILVDSLKRTRSEHVYNELVKNRISALLQRENYPDWERNFDSIMGYVFRQAGRINSK